MIKRSKKETGGPKAVVPPSAEFFAKLTPTTSSPAPATARKVSGKEALDALKGIGTGWDEELERLINVPAQLFKKDMDSGVLFSDDDRFGVSLVMSMTQPNMVPKTQSGYGIALYGSGTSTFFLLMDIARGIIVRERIINFHDEPSEKDWSVVKSRIKEALAAAGKNKGKEIAVSSDGFMRFVPIEQG
jgi:hypothetical protein